MILKLFRLLLGVVGRLTLNHNFKNSLCCLQYFFGRFNTTWTSEQSLWYPALLVVLAENDIEIIQIIVGRCQVVNSVPSYKNIRSEV